MKKILLKNISGLKVAVFFTLTNVVYAQMLLKTIPKVMEFSDGMKILDMMPGGYDLDYVNDLMKSLGDEGRQAYLTVQIPVDMIYPALFGISYCLLLAFFLNKLHKLNDPMAYLCWLPVVAGLFDYMENMGIISMLVAFPDLNPSTAAATNFFTLVKSGTSTIYFVVLLVVMLAVGIRYFKRRFSV